MKASEMTNEELAGAVESIATRRLFAINEEGYLREAAARLRKIDDYAEMCANTMREVTALLAKLKVAEDALTKLQDRLVSSVHDGTIDPYEALKIAEVALAAIREQGGGKPIRNCDRFETAEDAYNACPQFCDIDVKTMTDRELKIVEATTKFLKWLFAPIAEGGAK